ncbi:MAG: hypothetical protein ACK5HL_01655 [Bacilli bacterium]
MDIRTFEEVRNTLKSLEISKQYIQEGYEMKTPSHMDVFTKQNDYFRNGISVLIQFLYPLLLIIIGCVTFHKKIHSGFFKNIIIRKTFKKFINSEIFKSWKAALLIPLFVVITFFSCFITQFNFDLSSYNSSKISLSVVSEKSIILETVKMILMTINLLFQLLVLMLDYFFQRKTRIL